MEFTTWRDFVAHAATHLGHRPYSGEGIKNYKNGKSLLRSVAVPYYADTEDRYTAQGLIGDQSLEKKVNRDLQQPGRQLFLYEVKTNGRKKTWIWHGEYRFRGEIETMQHPDILKNMRTIYRFVLHKV